MRKKLFIPAFFVLAVVACNNANNDETATDTTTANTSMDSMHHDANNTGVAAMQTPPAGAKVYFVNLKDNQTVKPSLTIEMGVDGMSVDTAGSMQAGTGHHHLLIDAGDSIPGGQVVPKDSTHLHFGKAQKEAVINLPEGTHKLTLQFADGLHRSYGGQMATSITVNIKK